MLDPSLNKTKPLSSETYREGQIKKQIYVRCGEK